MEAEAIKVEGIPIIIRVKEEDLIKIALILNFLGLNFLSRTIRIPINQGQLHLAQPIKFVENWVT